MGTLAPHYPDDHPPSAARNEKRGSLPSTACVVNAGRGQPVSSLRGRLA